MKKLFKSLFIILMGLVLLQPKNVHATSPEVQGNSFTLNMVANNETSLIPGETVEITLRLSDINAGVDGINTVEGILDYDETVFEEITSSNIQSLNNWSIDYNSEELAFLAFTLQEGVTQDQDIVKITFTVRENVQVTSTTIGINDIVSNDGDNFIEDTDKAITFQVDTGSGSGSGDGTGDGSGTGSGDGTGDGSGTGSGDGTGTGNGNGNGTGSNIPVVVVTPSDDANGGQGNIIKPATSPSATTNTSTTNSNSQKLPQTGTTTTYIVIAGITILAIGVVAYVKYKKMDI